MNEETTVSPDAETQNPAPELTETPELVTPEPDEQGNAEDTQAEDPIAKIQARFDRRISRATAARYQAEARAQQAEEQARAAAERLAQYEQRPEAEAITPERVQSIARGLAAQMREQEKVIERVQGMLSAGKDLEGFNAACNAVDEELPFYEQGNKPTPFLRAVMECDAPAKVLHYLGTHPDDAADLVGLTPTQQARRLDRIERDLAKPAEPKPTSLAPRPVTPVRTATRDAGGLSDNLPADEWQRRFYQARAQG